MTTPYHRIGRNAHRLPAGYFADAQDHLPAGPLASATPNLGGPSTSAASENLERPEQSGAEHREVSGVSGAAVHFGATATASSVGSQATQAHAPAYTLAIAPSYSAVVGTSTDRYMEPASLPSGDAGNHLRGRAEVPLAGNHQSSRPALDTDCDDVHRLRAARTLFGNHSSKPHVSR